MNKKTFSIERFKLLSGSSLKLIAVVTMLIDHFADVFRDDIAFLTLPLFGTSFTIYYILRKIGRLAFPIFCFLIAEGFIHTKDRKKYGLNLLIFALISEIPFDLCFFGSPFHLSYQNVYFTLFLGFLVLCILEYVKNDLLKLVLSIITALTANFFNTDYGILGVLLIVMIYCLREQKVIRTLIALPFLSGGLAAWCAFLPINMYNEKRGFIKGKVLKYVFYAFYPLHILLLFLIDKIV